MLSLRFRSILTFVFAAILIAITGCGGMSNTASNPSNPPTPAPGGNPGGTGSGGGAPQSSTFVYLNNLTSSLKAEVFVFKLNADGSLTSMSNSPLSDPGAIAGQSGKLLVGSSAADHLTTYAVDPQSGLPKPAISSVNVSAGGAVADSTTVYLPTLNGVDAYSISSTGQLARIPGAPFGSTPPDFFFGNSYGKLQIVGSFLFGDLNTVKDAGSLHVFSRGSNGALTDKADIGDGNSPVTFVVHPGGHFAYDVECCDLGSLHVFSFDPSSGSSSMIQQVPMSADDFSTLDPAGRFLFMRDRGIRVFSIDQASGKLTEVSGSPFIANDSSIHNFSVDPSGHFLIVERQNSVSVYSIAAAGALTQAGPTLAVGDDLGRIAFATF